MLNSIPLSWLYILPVFQFFFSFLANFDVVHVHLVVNIQLPFDKFMFAGLYWGMRWSAIIAITDCNGNSASLGNIYLLIFTADKLFSSCCQFPFPSFRGFFGKPFVFIATLFRLVLFSLRSCWSLHGRSLVLFVPLWHLFYSAGNSQRLFSEH